MENAHEGASFPRLTPVWYILVPHTPCAPCLALYCPLPCNQVETRINIRTILQKSPEAAKHMVTEARKVLESWHATYMDVRHRIEESGTDHRWEFDRKRLFEQTNYMAKVCGDLLEVNETVLPP